MPVVEVKGKSLEEIRQIWAEKWKCSEADLHLEILEEPRFFNRYWKVRVSLIEREEEPPLNPEDLKVTITWQDDRYLIELGTGVKQVIPFPLAGRTFLNGKEQELPFGTLPTDRIEFVPVIEPGKLTWDLEVQFQGLSVVAVVTHHKPGRYVLPPLVEGVTVFDIQKHVTWQDESARGEYWDKKKLEQDLAALNVVHGIKGDAWEQILAVEGVAEVIVAEATLPVPPQPPQVEDYVGEIEVQEDPDAEFVDFFASKVKLVEEGTVLARKIPGVPGTPGRNVFGKEIPTQPFKDRHFRLKKNVRLSEDGLQVIATCGGLPRRIDEWTYSVENVYVLNGDVDLSTGSIEFTGDVIVFGNVQDGFHIYAGGKVEIGGSVAHGEIRAEKGLRVMRNILSSKVIVGENYVKRSTLSSLITEVRNQLEPCLEQVELLAAAEQAKRLTPNQCLKLLLEQRFQDLPRRAAELEKFVTQNEGEFITQELIVAARTLKHFVTGLGPLEPQSVTFLKRAGKVICHVGENNALEIPDKLTCMVDYVQGSTIECGGDFECGKGSYNSTIRANGDVRIDGVCRGGTIIADGNITIRELGGMGVSTTIVKMSGNKRLKVSMCHPNVIIYVDKHIVRIDEACRNLEVYREKGVVQVEKLKVHNY